MRRPSVQLFVGRQAPPLVGRLARELSRWVELRVPGGDRSPVGRLVVAPYGVEASDPLSAVTAYVLIDDAEPPQGSGVGAILVDWNHPDPAPHDAIRIPHATGAASSCRPVSPVVRARWRARAGLPVDLVIDRRRADQLHGDVLDTAQASAAAVWATGPSAERALAFGAPVVTDHTTAHELRLVAGVDALVVDAADADAALGAIVADHVLAARLSLAGRAAAERCDLQSVVHSLVLALRWLDTREPLLRIAARLDEMGTPPDAGVRRRAMAHEFMLSEARGGR